jgi:exocyst complex component 4
MYQFAPSSLALSLISSSTRSGSHPPLREFLALHAALSSALQRAVQKHYQTYASSLPEHAQLLSALSRAQGLVRETKKQLLNSKDLLSGGVGDVDDATPQAGLTTGKRAEMGSLWNKERTLKDMLKTLDVM